MIYADETHDMMMDGTVVIDHRDDAPSNQEFRLSADKVTAELPAPAPPAGTKAPGIQQLRATGNVVVVANGGELHCELMRYDPSTHLVTATTTNDGRVIFYPAATVSGRTMEAQELEWDLAQSLPRATSASLQMRH
jgi:hypothetical protein